MNKQLKFAMESVEQCHSDMVEINLNANRTGSGDELAPLELSSTLQFADMLGGPLHRGYPYGYSDVDNTELYFCQKSKFVDQKTLAPSPSPPPATSISCLRQMYCPECHERLHEQGVRLERLFSLCCFPLLPIYPCCAKRNSDDCKVICGKCGYLLGAWKRQ